MDEDLTASNAEGFTQVDRQSVENGCGSNSTECLKKTRSLRRLGGCCRLLTCGIWQKNTATDFTFKLIPLHSVSPS